jgi:DNA helicase-2/ATP-dependent DNA helicase PcrA
MATGNTEETEEERRLLYVAMTRAKDTLVLVVPQRFYTHGQAKRGDRHVYAARTRFIPAQIVGCFDRRSWPTGARGLQPDGRRNAPTVDLAARMRGMWRATGG